MVGTPTHCPSDCASLCFGNERLRRRRVRYSAGLIGLAAWLCLGAAAAREFDPNDIRIITPTEATSTCIGEPKTPVCAVETMMACMVRRDESLCRRVGIEKACFDSKISGIAYRIDETRFLRESDIPEYVLKMRREQVADVLYQYAYCGYGPCDVLADEAALTLIEVDALWRFAGVPLDADQCSPDPD
jgi:hypothetical protein